MERRSFLGALGALVAGVVGRKSIPEPATDLRTLQPTLAYPPTDTSHDGSVWVRGRFTAGEDLDAGLVYIGDDGKVYNSHNAYDRVIRQKDGWRV